MSTPSTRDPAPAPLAGIRVLEIAARAACRACGSLLAQMGAQVVAVESGGDEAAGAERRAALVAGKRSFRPRPRSTADARALEALLHGADVVILSGDEDSLHLDPVRAALAGGGNVAPIVVDVRSVHGAVDGAPPLDDLAVQALSGMMETTGMPDGPPCVVDGEPLEMIAALHALTGVLAALLVRARDSLAQRVEVSLMDCAISSHAVFVSRLMVEPGAPATRSGNRHLLASPWNVFRAADGWLLICMASEPQWHRACALMGDPQLAFRPGFDSGVARQGNLDAVEAAVQEWVERLPVAEVSRLLLEAGIPCGAVATVDGHPREENLRHRGMVMSAALPGSGRTVYLPGSPLHASRTPGIAPGRVPAADADRAWAVSTPWAPRERRDPAPPGERPPLAGVRVLELGHYTTAPLAGRYLANLGAEVIKIEPPGGEVMRRWMPQRHGVGAFFIVNNTGKASVTLDLKTAQGMAALESMVRTADVLLENLKPGALERMGLGFGRMQALNTGLVYCAVSGFGVDSVYPGRPAYDTVIQAMSGIMDRTRACGQPVKTGMSAADALGANFCVVAILAALLERRRSGQGQLIDVSMQDVAAWSLQLTWNGAPRVDERAMVCACADGHVVLARAAFDESMGGAMAGLTREQCRARWPGMVWPVRTLGEALRAPECAGQALEIDDTRGRAWPVIANPIRLSRTPLRDSPILSDLGADDARLLGRATPIGESP